MRKEILVMIVLFCLSVLPVCGEKLAVLTEVVKPEAIDVAGDRLYVVQGATFYVYSLKTLKFVTRFGREGEGPGELKEFIYPNGVAVLHDKILVEGFNKVILFSKDFKLLKEIRKKGWMFKVMPVGENFVALRMLSASRKDFSLLALSLLDSQMNVIKELYKQETPDKDTEVFMVHDTIHFAVYKDRIYVEESDKGFLVEVFDSKGNRLFGIRKKLTAQKITEQHKKAIIENFKEDKLVVIMMKGAGGWENFKKSTNFVYPDTFPLIQDIRVTDDKIYAATYQTKDNKEKYIIMDLKGNIVSTPYLPNTKKPAFSARSLGNDNRFYAIADNKFYYLVENEDNEEWELHVTKIN